MFYHYVCIAKSPFHKTPLCELPTLLSFAAGPRQARGAARGKRAFKNVADCYFSVEMKQMLKKKNRKKNIQMLENKAQITCMRNMYK